MSKKLPIFYSALLLTLVNLLLRLVGTSFQVYLSGRIGAEGIGLLQLVMSVGGLAMVAGMAGIRTGAMYLTAEELGHRRPEQVTWVLSGCFRYSVCFSGFVAAVFRIFADYLFMRHSVRVFYGCQPDRYPGRCGSGGAAVCHGSDFGITDGLG